MTHEEILEGNKLIAEFMDGIPDYAAYYGLGTKFLRGYTLKSDYVPALTYYSSVDELKYHKDWNYLMPVVEKINKETGKIVRMEGYACDITSTCNENPSKKPFKIFNHKNSLIDATYTSVVEFIKWYNTQNMAA